MATFNTNPSNYWYNISSIESRLSKMLLNTFDNSGVIRFKYYGEFDTIEKIHADCKDDLTYVGNSRIDGSPIFVYHYDTFNISEISKFDILNKKIRSIKLKHYSGKEMTKKERSILTFFKFFMVAYENLEIKGLSDYEIKTVNFNTI